MRVGGLPVAECRNKPAAVRTAESGRAVLCAVVDTEQKRAGHVWRKRVLGAVCDASDD